MRPSPQPDLTEASAIVRVRGRETMVFILIGALIVGALLLALALSAASNAASDSSDLL
jgi:hypothetical protein